MKLRFGDLFTGAGAYWRGGPEALVAVAGVFFFLPQLANLLFVPVFDATGLEGVALTQAMLDFFMRNLPWSAAQFIAESMGVATVLLMLLDPARPSVGEALGRALRLLPGLVVARLIAAAAVMLGLLLLFVPGFYLSGRTFLTSAVYVFEPQRGPGGAAVAGFERTRGNGWLFFLAVFGVSAVWYIFGGMIMQGALAAGPFAAAPLKALVAALVAGCMLLIVLLEATAYRALSGPKHGM